MTDYLTCGQCLKEFPLQKITLFIQHKKLDCEDEDDSTISDPELQCNFCPQGFMTAWGLLIHAQISHNLKLFLERASRNLLKETKVYPENPSNDKTVFLLPKTFKATPLKAITDYTTEVDNIVTANISTSLEHNQLQVTKNVEQLFNAKNESMQFAVSVGDSPRFGSNITVTRDLDTGVKEVMGELPAEKTGSQSAANLIYEKEITGNTITNATVADVSNAAVDDAVSERVQELTHNESEMVSCRVSDIGPETHHTTMVRESTESRESTQGDPVSEHGLDNKGSDSSSVFNDTEKFETGDSLTDTALGTTGTELSASSSECCDNQGCGITVIPGTHQDLQKCCNAVVPKKRKRHMEMKHMSLSWSSSRYGRRRLINRSLSNMKSIASANLAKSSSIYIEVEPDSAMLDKQTNNNNDTDERSHESAVGFNITSETLSSASPVSASNIPVQALSGAESKPRSLILKPGAIFSIPFTYTIPVTSTISALRFNTPVTTSSVSKKAPVLAASLSHHGYPSETSQLQTAVKLPQTTLPDNDSGPKRVKVTDPRRHQPSKPFPCETCSMTFNQRIHLKKHIMSKHTGNKPYKCGECDYSTVERSHLKVHIRIHTGEKPFKCTYCEYATAQNSTLKIHLKRHHGGKMFHCASCEKEFTQEQQLREHDCEHVTVTGPDRKCALQTSGPAETETAQTLDHQSALIVDRVDNSTTDESSQAPITSLPDLKLVQTTEADLTDTNDQTSP